MFIRRQNISNISKNIKDYRIKEGLNQKEFAELLEMNYQNYSKMERGVYTPSLDKLLDICDILYLTPNDLLLEGRDFDDYKKETLEKLDASIIEIASTMKTFEEIRAKALRAKIKGQEKKERYYLDDIIQMFAWENEHMWTIADFLYYKKIDRLLKDASSRTMEELAERIKK